jgi:bla regulator protein blaR1
MSRHDRYLHRSIALIGSLAIHLLLAALVVAASWPESPVPASWSNHLWQSTLFAAAIALLTRGFTANHARVRYWLWFSASLKFLIPFSVLVSIGSALPWRPGPPAAAPSGLSEVITQISQPFLDDESPGRVTAQSVSKDSGWLTFVLLAIWACGAITLLRLRLRMWHHIHHAVVTSTPITLDDVALPAAIRLRAASGVLEPGVVGLWRPVILMPAGIDRYLTRDQLEAVLSHEVCHIKRQDNLLSAVHMLVEIVFWFHPMVWWIGRLLIAERERACDEEVLRTQASPRAYAEGIIRVCERYVDARLACVAGVSGSDLKKRIEAIMNHEIAERLSVWKKTVLLSSATVTAAFPIVIGMLDAPRLQAHAQERRPVSGALAFDSVSVKRNVSPEPGRTLNAEAEGWLTATNTTVAQLIRFAYDLPAFQVSGGPTWINSETFDVTARANGNPSLADKRMMLRRLLAERFSLSAHTETRELPIYALTRARSDGKLGPRLRASETDCRRVEQPTLFTGVGAVPSGGPPACGYFGFSPTTNLPSGRGGLAFRGLTMPALALKLIPMVRRTVVDDTGLPGYYDADFDFLAELPPPPPPPGMPNPWSEPFVSVLTVLPEQLGLKLDSRRGQVEMLVIDRVEPPTEN